jgi:hypothetical protein
MHFLSLARATAARKGYDFEDQTNEKQFIARNAEISKEITRYIKRVRKNSAASLRYLVVTEAHKSGDPHYHALIHEVHPDEPVRKAILKDCWKLGFSHHKLVKDPIHASYVCKYLSKTMSARVRASQHYGRIISPVVLQNVKGTKSIF